jgi:hypothetical protein
VKGYFSGIYFVTLILTTGSSVFLIAPSVHHRLLFRLQEKERVVVVANGLSLNGVTLLALAMTGVVTDFPQCALGGRSRLAHQENGAGSQLDYLVRHASDHHLVEARHAPRPEHDEVGVEHPSRVKDVVRYVPSRRKNFASGLDSVFAQRFDGVVDDFPGLLFGLEVDRSRRHGRAGGRWRDGTQIAAVDDQDR